MDPEDADLAARFAAIYPRLDHPPGVRLGVLRLPILEPVLGDIEALAADEAVPATVVVELTRLAELLSAELLGSEPETVPWRGRIVELLRIADGGRLPALAADDQDPFGAELRAMLASDDGLRAALGQLHPLALRATAVAPPARWLREANDLAAGPDGSRLVEATRRALAALVRAPIESRPDLLLGGVRPVNQRLARGLLWFASATFPAPAATLGAVGLRMGTSGRSDAVARDVALANTCAALLGAATDPGAASALVSMRRGISNRTVLKQVDRALEVIAARAATTVDHVVDEALPAYGLEDRRRLEMAAGRVHAVVSVEDGARTVVAWRDADGVSTDEPPADVARDEPAAVADVAATVAAIDAALIEERGALEMRLGSVRSWPGPVVRRRFLDHPVAGVVARRLVWAADARGSSITILPLGIGWTGVDDRPVEAIDPEARFRLWHPAESGEAEIAAWRATLAARAIRQPFRQADRETFHAAPPPAPASADLRFAGRIVDHGRLRALLRERGWAVPALGAWDQGDEATGWRSFDEGLRAELRYQAPDRVPTGERIQQARLVAIRFIRTDAPAASPAGTEASLSVRDVPPRVFSEALRDVSLAVVVGESTTG